MAETETSGPAGDGEASPENQAPRESAPLERASPGPTAPLPGGPTKRDLTTGGIFGHIVALAVPAAASNLLNYSYHFVDMLWLGRLGPTALAVTGTYHYFFMLLVIFNQIVGIGSITLIARTFGAKDFPGCRRFIGQTFSFKLVIALVVMALGLVFQRWAWVAFGSAPEVVEQGLAYTTIMFSVIPIYFSAFTLRTSLSSIGDMKTILIISAISTALNIVLDPFFIFETVYIGPFPAFGVTEPLLTLPGLGLGVAGAAWASFGSILVLFTLGLWYFVSGRTYIRVGLRQFFSWHWGTVWRILRIGTPPAVGENLNSVAQIVIGRVLNIYGTAVFAANSVVGLAFGLVWVPVGGITQAVMTLVGQNLGAQKPERAKSSVYGALTMTTVLLVVVLAAAAIWAEPLVRVIVPGNTPESLETLRWGVQFLRVTLLMMLFTGIGMVFSSAFWGSGDTKPPMYTQVVASYAIQLPIVLVGALYLKLSDPMFIMWSGVASALANALAIWLVFQRGKWFKVKV